MAQQATAPSRRATVADDKARITVVIPKDLEADIQDLADGESRSKSKMAYLLLDEAVSARRQRKGQKKR